MWSANSSASRSAGSSRQRSIERQRICSSEGPLVCVALSGTSYPFESFSTASSSTSHSACPVLASNSVISQRTGQAFWKFQRPTSVLPSGASATTEPLRSEEHTSELQSRRDLVCRLL